MSMQSMRSANTRLVARTILLLALAEGGFAGRACSQREAGGPIAETARRREREVMRREGALRSEVGALQRRFADVRYRTPEWVRLETERRLLDEVAAQLAGERNALNELMYARPGDLASENQVLSQANLYVTLAQEDFWARAAQTAGLKLDAAVQAGYSAEALAPLQRELALHQRILDAKAHARATWDEVLTALRLPSVADLRERRERRNAASAAAQRAHDQEAAESVRSFVLTFGVAAAVAAILSSPHATAGQRDEARHEWLDRANQSIRSSCTPPKHFVPAGDDALGSCVP